MNSRAPARSNPALPRNASTSLDPPTTTRTTAINSTTSSIRRNLFPQAGAARRQLRHHHEPSISSGSGSALAQSDRDGSGNNDIITRDPVSGTFTIDAPQVPAGGREQTVEEEEEEARRRMIEEWRRVGDGVVDQSEIKAVLMASLEEKVASLDDDGWMFGDEEKEEE